MEQYAQKVTSERFWDGMEELFYSMNRLLQIGLHCDEFFGQHTKLFLKTFRKI